MRKGTGLRWLTVTIALLALLLVVAAQYVVQLIHTRLSQAPYGMGDYLDALLRSVVSWQTILAAVIGVALYWFVSRTRPQRG